MRPSKVFIPNAITSTAILVGYLAIMAALGGYYVLSAWLLLCIALLDSLDGRVARALNATSEFGAQFDSLADVLNFGIVPSILFHQAFFHDLGLAGMVLSFMPTLFSAFRLARFNVENEDHSTKASHFTGLPTTLSALLLGSFVIFAAEIWGAYTPDALPAALVLLVSFLMVSEVPYASNTVLLAGLRVKNHKKMVALLFLCSLLVLPGKAFFIWAIAYVLVGFVRSAFETISDRRLA